MPKTTANTRLQTRVNRINRVLSAMDNYHVSIPLGPIFEACIDHGLIPMQEDGTPWSGLLCGSEGETVIDLDLDRIGHEQKPSGRALVLAWYYRPRRTSNYEIISYVS